MKKEKNKEERAADRNLSEDQVRVQIARCPACKKIVKMAVVHMMGESSKNEFMELMELRCEISQVGLKDARGAEMCFLNCDKPLVVKREVITEKTGNEKLPHGICVENNCKRPAVIDYNEHEHWVCQEHYDSLSRYFDEEYN
ncbi:MAG TPA: hypothetical protein VNX68_07105 [Nitrosopumilaceae archaeon]|nr:hypothetical protein [Nitrosopumilaceae archaeon]